ncbi:E3 SUMO-protein ligase ZBED1-like [Bemisia tabaci]|uniref:E3 SUMO-protein ligase ZBED1-like n=1 Tax=Bemisia tabaci TaxID=7038 RepID=UPI003B2849B2
MTNTFVPSIKDDMNKTIKSLLKQATYCSMTGDIWTADNGDSFFGLTCHFLDNSWDVHSVCLGCVLFNESHTGENIEEFIRATLDEWNMPLGKIVAATTDNGSNILLAVEMLELLSLGCFAHTLQIGVDKVLRFGEGGEVVKKCKKLQNLFAYNTSAAKRDLNDLSLTRTGKKALALPAPCSTRWWSYLRLLVAVVKQHGIISELLTSEKYATKYEIYLLTVEELSYAKILIQVLTQLKELSDGVSGEDYVTASCVLPLITVLQKSSSSNSATTISADSITSSASTSSSSMQGCGQPASSETAHVAANADRTRAGKKYRHAVQARKLLLKCAFCDLRYFFELSEDDQTDAETAILGEMIRMCQVSNRDGPPPAKRKCRGIAAFFSAHGNNSVTAASESPEDQAMTEIRRYKQMVRVDVGENIAKWWQVHEKEFPRLAILAKKYLSVTATSIPAERVFSTGGRVVTDSRHSLTGLHVNDLVQMSCNKRYIL